jgi:[NiFe] hydrogenase diaphorase moiety large subunit
MLKPSTTFFRHEPKRSQLVNELWKAQKRDRYITEKTMGELAKSLDISLIEIQGVVSFYHFFHTQPTAKHVIYLNNSLISKTKGYDRIREALERETGTRFNTTDRTETFALFETPCIGLSDQEPAALIDFYPFTNLNVMKVREIITALKSGTKASDICDQPADHIRYLPQNNHTIFFRPYTAGEALSKAVAIKPEEVIQIVKTSELSGRGGAFFPTWIKWEGCRKETTTPKYVVCNADEGEPGTFKDRVLLNKEPGSVLEGMIIAGYAIGAKYGIIYLRAEYKWLLKTLEDTIQRFYDQRLLGRSIKGMDGFDFDIRIQVGAGSYVCGEETALLESMEGKRGEPRTKWYFPVQRGYLQKPTIINNVETFAAVARMMEMGINNYLNRGIPGSPGTKLISLSGDVQKPGIYEIEWGMQIEELLELAEGEDPFYIQLSGPSGECISMNQKHRRISMRDLMSTQDIRCGGSVMVLNRHRDIMDILHNFSDFFLKESCGVCTPCRAGNYIIHKKLEKMAHGLATREDVEEMHQWCHIMKETSRCGLGKTAYNTPLKAIEEFSDYFRDKLEDASSDLNLKFNMEEAISDYEKYRI